jgi:hypothetical protein
VPQCPQNASSWPTSLPQFGHLITIFLFLVAYMVLVLPIQLYQGPL